ncbi:MAG: hypothetical protein IJL52_02230 [Clostridia bacterium]|nr:hypothetical protein [Clostridia bacterium]
MSGLMAGKRPWLSDFHPGGNGDYAYRGGHKQFSGGADCFRRFRLTVGICTAAAAACVIASGCLPVSALYNTAYVMLPYVIEVVLTVAFVWSAVRLLANGELLRGYVHRQTAQRLPVLGAALALAVAATLVCTVIFVALHWPVAPWFWGLIALQFILILSSLYSIKVLRAARWTDV